MTKFDNLQSDSCGSIRSHYNFTINNTTVSYCYIRKNGCSAFKRLICETSKVADFESFKGIEIDFMAKHHSARSISEVVDSDIRMFVYRDPFERLISLFSNKFIVRNGCQDIFQNYSDLMGHSPDAATWGTFVRKYCRQKFKLRDVHARPQYKPLLAVQYNVAVELEALYETTTHFFGLDIADCYFKEKTNGTPYADQVNLVTNLSSLELNQRFQKSGRVPSRASFADPELQEIVYNTYDQDYKMIEAISGSTL